MDFRNIHNVVALPQADFYACDLELFVGGQWVAAQYAAAPNAGGISSAVYAAIAAGNFIGTITPYSPPPEPAPHETPLNPAQWDFALRANGLRGPIVAALDALEGTDPVRAAHLASRVFSRDRYVYEDVIALLAANGDVLPVGVADLTEAEVQAMWAATLAAVPA